MKIYKLGTACPFCRNKSKTRIHRTHKQPWIPFSRYYKCSWCYELYTTVMHLFSIGIK